MSCGVFVVVMYLVMRSKLVVIVIFFIRVFLD